MYTANHGFVGGSRLVWQLWYLVLIQMLITHPVLLLSLEMLLALDKNVIFNVRNSRYAIGCPGMDVLSFVLRLKMYATSRVSIITLLTFWAWCSNKAHTLHSKMKSNMLSPKFAIDCVIIWGLVCVYLWKYCVHSIVCYCYHAKFATGVCMTIWALKPNSRKRGSRCSTFSFWYPNENLLQLYKSCLLKV